jgi:uncharacterized membrane protein YGL010W
MQRNTKDKTWYLKNPNKIDRHLWLMPVILVTWEVEIQRIVVLGHLRQKVCETLLNQ